MMAITRKVIAQDNIGRSFGGLPPLLLDVAYWLLPPLLGLGLELPPLDEGDPLFCRWVDPEPLPVALPDELPLGLSIRWLPLPLLLPLPLVPRSQAAKPPARKADTSTAVTTRCLVIASLLEVEKNYS